MPNPDALSTFLLVVAANENNGAAWISEDPRIQPTSRTGAWFQAIGDACRAKVLRRQPGGEPDVRLLEEATADEAPASGWVTVSASRDSTRDRGR